MEMKNARLFELIRMEDFTGISGTGTVAEGVEWADKTATIHWLGHPTSTAHYNGIADIMSIHGHGGATRVRFK